jgi:NAD(P)-dependent dehydrogenase (short-subunit alcohol dehydrogenase family)
LGGGEIHAFFNNAGIEEPVAAAEDYPIEAFDQLFGVVLDPGGLNIERLDQATGALSRMRSQHDIKPVIQPHLA